jgi:arylformamidase
MGTHVGTHIDAPMHMIASGKSLDQIPLDHFVGRGRYIKVSNRAFDLDDVKKAGIQAGDIVLFHTGMGDIYHQPAYFSESPPIPEDVASYLVEKRVKMVGMDMFGPDQPPFPIHKILLSAGVLIIENLTNLELLAEKEFTVYALPIKLAIDAAPARVIANIR